MTLSNTWLVQRLTAPVEHDNPFNFGGGLVQGGFSPAAMDLLRPIFSFDYMGAAEYEFGDVPKCFGRIAELASANKLVGFKVEILLSKVKPDFRDKSKPERGSKGTVYVLADTDLRAEVTERVYEMAQGKVPTKGGHFLERSLRPFSEWDSETKGGLEMANDFLYFTDREMFEKTANLFAVDVSGV